MNYIRELTSELFNLKPSTVLRAVGTAFLGAYLAVTTACGGGSNSPPPPPPPQPTSMSIAGKTIHYFDKSPISENVRVQYAGTNPVTDLETTSSAVDGKYTVTISDVRGADPNASSTLLTGQPKNTGTNTPWYKVTITGLKLGATPNTTVTIPDVSILPRFRENGSQPNYPYYEVIDWYKAAIAAVNGQQSNWTYPIEFATNDNDPLAVSAKNSGKDFPAALKQSADSWEGCSTTLKNQLFKYVTTLTIPNTGVELVYVSDPNQPCIVPLQPTFNNATFTKVYQKLQINVICVINSTTTNQGKQEIGHVLGFSIDDPELSHIMNPTNVITNPNATQSPVECEATKWRWALPRGYNVNQLNK